MMYESKCIKCKYIKTFFKCEAFPSGIPKKIWYGIIAHDKPYKGDNGIQFRQIYHPSIISPKESVRRPIESVKNPITLIRKAIPTLKEKIESIKIFKRKDYKKNNEKK